MVLPSNRNSTFYKYHTHLYSGKPSRKYLKFKHKEIIKCCDSCEIHI